MPGQPDLPALPVSFRHHPLTRAFHYLFLLPFVPALQPLIIHYRLLDMMVYLCSAILVIVLVVYGNQRPLIRIEENRLCLFLHYRHNAEYHPFEHITGYTRRKGSWITIHSENHRPLPLHLEEADLNVLVAVLNHKCMHISEK